jgi:hypothetical protein
VADSKTFEYVCTELERSTSLDRLEARGTVRLALQGAGLDARTVRPNEMAVVLEKVLPPALQARGVDDGARCCEVIRRGLSAIATDGPKESPEDIFRRLGGAAG